MNLLELKDRLRARLNERVPDAFEDDADLIPLLNEGARYVAQKLAYINRRVNIVSDCADLIAGKVRYPLPADYLFEFEVRVGEDPAVSGTQRNRIIAVEPNRGKAGYYMDGMWINLTWEPEESILCGLQVKHCAALALINDGDIPPIPSDIHMAIVVAAERFAVPQVGEAAKEQLSELKELLGDLDRYYKQENAEEPQMQPMGLQFGVATHGSRSKYTR